MAAGEQQSTAKISSTNSSGRPVTPFWKEKYERDARRYWDIFYKRHEDKFFKDRHYLDKEWGKYFEVQDGENMAILEVGCGAGNTIFPLLATYPDIFVHACDFSSRAVDLVKKHKDFRSDRVNAFACDITSEQLTEAVEPSSVDIVTMIFMLSAVAPDKMPLVLQNVRNILKHGGRVLFRDYAFGDLAQAQIIRIKAKGHDFKIKMLAKEYQHTCKSTGLMLWESAQFMCSLLAENPSIVAGKRVLEMGCGSAGICSMVAASSAQFVVATDGDAESLDLLRQNTSSNLEAELLNRISIRKLFWGNEEDVKAVRELSGNGAGFDCIIGTDVTYNPDATLPLFKTARALISDDAGSKAALILCYIQRRVDEDSILSAAEAQGFRLVDKWINGVHESNGIISSWFRGNDVCGAFRNVTLSILYFEV